MHFSNSKVFFILVIVVKKKVAKNETSFLTVKDINLNNGIFYYSYNI